MKTNSSYVAQQLLSAGKWFAYTLVLYAAYVLQATPGAFAIFGVKPVWLIAVCIAVCSQEDFYPSVYFGAFAGLLWDLSAGRVAGAFTLTLAVCCFCTNLLFEYYFRESQKNIALAAGLSAFAALLVDYFFAYVATGCTGLVIYFFRSVLATALYTVPAGLVCFYVVRFVHGKFKFER